MRKNSYEIDESAKDLNIIKKIKEKMIFVKLLVYINNSII